jgi:nitroreductase
MEISDMIMHRRSHFQKEFNGETATDEMVSQLLESSQWAPSHKLTLPWRFMVYKNESKVHLFDAIRSSIKSTSSDPIKLEKMAHFESPISHIIAIVLKPSLKVPEWEEIAALGAGIQNVYLALLQYPNFGGYWSTGLQTNSKEIRNFLGLSPSEIHFGYFIIGGITELRTKSQRPKAHIKWI